MSSQGSEFLTWLGQAFVVGVGWYVVHVLSANRDREKARRETLVKTADALSDDAVSLLLHARNYHSKARDVSEELRIKMSLQDLSIKVNALADIFTEAALLAQCRSQILALRKAISGRHFEDEHTGPLADNDLQYQLMAEAALELKRALLKIKNRQFIT